jgi:hypothetical protein
MVISMAASVKSVLTTLTLPDRVPIAVMLQKPFHHLAAILHPVSGPIRMHHCDRS